MELRQNYPLMTHKFAPLHAATPANNINTHPNQKTYFCSNTPTIH